MLPRSCYSAPSLPLPHAPPWLSNRPLPPRALSLSLSIFSQLGQLTACSHACKDAQSATGHRQGQVGQGNLDFTHVEPLPATERIFPPSNEDGACPVMVLPTEADNSPQAHRVLPGNLPPTRTHAPHLRHYLLFRSFSFPPPIFNSFHLVLPIDHLLPPLLLLLSPFLSPTPSAHSLI